jgi:Zn-dependent protease with chaperone function
MDFFEHQDRARRQTRKLVVLFVGSVAAIILSVYAVFAFALWNYKESRPPASLSGNDLESAFALFYDDLPWFDPELALTCLFGTSALILTGCFLRLGLLSDGGPAIARLLGGRSLTAEPLDAHETKLRNVVEEMALASGVPVPQIYLLEHEPGINAFAAGYASSDAVIGVTRGCLQGLTRDELQGVIAHEFSHILNGDMLLNMRLCGLVHGIVFIAQTGTFLLRFPFQASLYVDEDRHGRRGGMPPHFLALCLAAGLVLAAIGSIGAFFARMIRSAISRQREYLADAASVQFTRNPEGIAGALKKIGGFKAGSRVQSLHASEASHFFFGDFRSADGLRLFATHPPLLDRILRIDPQFDGSFPETTDIEKELPEDAFLGFQGHGGALETAKPARPEPASPPALPSSPPPWRHRTAAPAKPPSPEELLRSLGSVQTGHLYYAAEIRDRLAGTVSQAAHEPFAARAVVLGLLLASPGSILDRQLAFLASLADAALMDEVRRLLPGLQPLDEELKLAAVDLSIPALRHLSPGQYREFRRLLEQLVLEDQTISLFEYTLQKIVVRHLDPFFGKSEPSRGGRHSLEQVLPEINTVLSALAYAGAETESQAQAAHGHGVAQLNVRSPGLALASEQAPLDKVDAALEKLSELTPSLKKNVLYACASAVARDNLLQPAEIQLLRAVADTLDCPIPPFARAY